jgi:hypothetical protein
MILKKIIEKANKVKRDLTFPSIALNEQYYDNKYGLGCDPGVELSMAESIHWLCRAQDNSKSCDNGVARHYSLINGWGPSYPETTGYIIPTILDYAESYNKKKLIKRATKMLDWLVDIQLSDGGFQGGTVICKPVVPVTFNTGQILIGLARGAAQFGKPYQYSMRKAADWLTNTQDSDGCWRENPTPFATVEEKAYETHVSWGLFEAARASGEKKYADAAIKNIKWALTKQHPNGWFDNCCLVDSNQPLTHTLGYVLRGILEAHHYTNDSALLKSAELTAQGLLSAIDSNGFIPGRLDKNWNGTVSYACLTGTVQIAHCWLLLYLATGDTRYRDSAYAANKYVRKTVQVNGNPNKRGGIKGSFPVSGHYAPYEYLNWAAKFFIDSNLLEKKIRCSEK